MADERARDRDAVTQQETQEQPPERLVEQRVPALSGADWFFAHAVTMRAAHVRPVDPADEEDAPRPEA